MKWKDERGEEAPVEKQGRMQTCSVAGPPECMIMLIRLVVVLLNRQADAKLEKSVSPA